MITFEVVASYLENATEHFGQKSVHIGTEVLFKVLEYDYEIEQGELPSSHQMVATKINYAEWRGNCGPEEAFPAVA